MTRGSVEEVVVPGTAAGDIRSLVQVPEGPTPAGGFATLYLLHGRGDSAESWLPAMADAAVAATARVIPPVVLVAVDGPWLSRAHWWVDSGFDGGAPVESAITRDLVGAVDARFPTSAARGNRFIAGVSMGGAGAIRYLLARQDLFSRALALSPAVYLPSPPLGSNTRRYGAFGVGGAAFDEARYAELGYQRGLERVDPGLPVELRVVAGDRETPHRDPADVDHDLDVEAARLVARARRAAGVTARLEVLDGAHGWEFWRPAFAEHLPVLTRPERGVPHDNEKITER